MIATASKAGARRRAFWISLLTVWAACVGVGFAALMKYSSTPGPTVAAPAHWPTGFPFKPEAQGLTLIVTLHPHCPCSRATVGQLARLMTRQASGVRAYFLVVKPADAPEGWELTDLWYQTRDIPGVVVMLDKNGVQSNRLGAKTSGQVYAFDSTGRALFSGGITPARSHMGESAGNDALAELLCGREAPRQTAPVFGCALDGPPDANLSGAAP